MKGAECYGTGAEASALASGLMSAEDKAKLDNGVSAADASILIDTDDDGFQTIAVQISSADGNILELADDGLYAGIETATDEEVTSLLDDSADEATDEDDETTDEEDNTDETDDGAEDE